MVVCLLNITPRSPPRCGKRACDGRAVGEELKLVEHISPLKSAVVAGYKTQMLHCLDTDKSSPDKKLQCDRGVILQLHTYFLSWCFRGDRLGPM